MENISKELMETVAESELVLRKMTAEDWNYRTAPGKWSRKEILGHLIDSAANNHQRFVRIQLENVPSLTYEQDNWVSIQKYSDEKVDALISLWASFNQHLAYLISVIPQDKYNNLCDIKKDEPVTLEWLAEDYTRHLKHHLDQIIVKH